MLFKILVFPLLCLAVVLSSAHCANAQGIYFDEAGEGSIDITSSGFSASANFGGYQFSLNGSWAGGSSSFKTDIYRGGGKTAKNLTPREVDKTTGLSVTTTKPKKGWQLPAKATLEALGFEVIADPTDDDPGHHLIKPGKTLVDAGHTLEDWADTRDDVDENDETTWHHLTKLLKNNSNPIK